MIWKLQRCRARRRYDLIFDVLCAHNLSPLTRSCSRRRPPMEWPTQTIGRRPTPALFNDWRTSSALELIELLWNHRGWIKYLRKLKEVSVLVPLLWAAAPPVWQRSSIINAEDAKTRNISRKPIFRPARAVFGGIETEDFALPPSPRNSAKQTVDEYHVNVPAYHLSPVTESFDVTVAIHNGHVNVLRLLKAQSWRMCCATDEEGRSRSRKHRTSCSSHPC